MSESAFVTAVYEKTGLVTSIPRHYLDLYPYREVSEDEIIELRREDELAQFGKYLTPAPRVITVAKEGVK